jgi:hypothetical protein
MKRVAELMKSLAWFAPAMIVAMSALLPQESSAQVPPRFYWRTLDGSSGVPLIVESVSGNTNPFNPGLAVLPGAQVAGTVAITGYANNFSLFDRSAQAVILLPMGRVSGDVTVAGNTINQSTNGFGDPTVEFNMNVLGPRAQKNLTDVLRYQPGFSVNVLGDLAFPIGQYDSSQALNLGQNRWYGRVGAPIVWQLGPWVPGKRTTLEFLPAVWLFGTNNNFVGQTLNTDPLFQLDAHLTRDFTEHFYGSLDGFLYNGAKQTIDGVAGDKRNDLAFGLTLGYQVNDNLSGTFGYKSTVNQNAPSDLRLDVFTISLVYGWHPIIEGQKRLKGEQ